MRALADALFASLIGLWFCASAAAAPPPPPPPGPQGLPAELRGYETQRLWTNYSLWVDERMGAARSRALDVDPPAGWLDSANPQPRWWRREGPRIRIYSNELGGGAYGADIAIHRWCLGEACVWAARRAISTGDVASFIRENFDIELAVEFLVARGVAPDQVPEYQPQSYGLPDPAAETFYWNFVALAQATERECPEVRQSLQIAEQHAEEMVIRKRAPAGARTSDPPWPHSALFEITIPGWDARRANDTRSAGMSAEVRLAGFANHAEAELVRAVMAPLRSCAALN